jgi:dTDP-4-dehydrorhamnose reductase
MRTIWITGSKGQLGTEINLQHNILTDTQFIFTDIAELDLVDKDAVEVFFATNKPDIIVNCAAYTAVDKAESETAFARSLNCDVPAQLAQLCDKVGAILIHISTDYVFDGTNYKPYVEEDITNPQSVYGKTKLDGEKAVLAYPNNLVIRTSWLYSAHGANFVKTMLRLGNEKSEINVIYDQIGTPTSAADLAGAILHILEKLSNGVSNLGGLYHFSNEGVCSWYDFAIEIMKTADLTCYVRPITSDQYPLPTPRPHYSVLNKRKIKAAFELEIPYWKESMLTCIEKLSKG